MNPESWEQAKQLYEAALKCPPGKRPQFLEENCHGDEEVRREVKSLLACADESASFLEKPAIGEFAEVIVRQKSLVGQKILQYKIIKLLGAGGMGEVYLAEDTRLKRQIALKILPASLSRNKKFVQRFEQEACAASALNHPNILTVHEFGEKDGMNFIASEYVKGETLRERLNGGKPLSLPEALDIASQVAAALRAAHESGIVHRDIKPENVMIRDDRLVKVLDFGLAKLTLKKNEAVETVDETIINTAPGMIMGTAAYMSPEQARGQPTDARTDIWSLGVLLYEMLSGKPPFQGETASDTIASILMREPAPFDENLPAELVSILQKALQKNRDERYETVKDFSLDLNTFKYKSEFAPLSAAGDGKAHKKITRSKIAAPTDATSGDLETTASENRSAFKTSPLMTNGARRLNRKLTATVALLLALAGAAAVWKIIPNRNQPPANLLASLRIKQLISWDGEAGEGHAGARFSPNGAMIAYSLTKNGQRNIWTKQIPDGKPNPITDGKWDYHNPVWSPDGQRIAFVSNRDNQKAIWAMPFSGGELTLIKAFESDNVVNLLRWSKNGATIYYRQGFNLFALDIASRQITKLTNFDSTNPAQFFSLSPDEDRIAYSAGSNERLHIFVMPVGGAPVQMTSDEASDEYPFWLPDGKRIIYSSKRDGVFQTCIVYLDEGRTEQINLGINDTLISDVAPDGGRILFQQSREESDLWRVGTDGKSETQITADSGLELWSDVSPDGKSVVFQAATESKHLLEGSILLRSTDDNQQINVASNGFSPTFSPDGRRIAFLRTAKSLINLWIADRNGADERQLTTEGLWFAGFSLVPYNRVQTKDYSWSPDGGSLIYCAKKDGLWNVWQVALTGDLMPRQISHNTDENVRFSGLFFAPDGKRIAYTASAVKTSSDAKKTINLYVSDGENTSMFFSSASVFKPLGWEKSGGNLLIAIAEDKSIAKPAKVRLSFISDGNNRTDLALIEAAYFQNIQLSPDGRRIAFAAREDGKDNIRIISVAGDENIKVTANLDPTTYLASLVWSPDGKTIYFSKQKQVGTISMIENFK
jgi:eukaryotic-like serine/threonine-protein kinase